MKKSISNIINVKTLSHQIVININPIVEDNELALIKIIL